MPKEATSLFELAAGATPPSDETLRLADAALKDKAMLESVIEGADAWCARLKFLSIPSRLEAARHIAKGICGTTRMFNVAIFLRDKEESHDAELFEEPKANEDLFS